jgi:integrase
MPTIDRRVGKDGKVSYRVRLRVPNKPLMTKTFSRKTDAKEWAMRTESDLRDGKIKETKQGKKRRLSHLVDRYIADILPQKPHHRQVKSKRLLAWWVEALENPLLTELTNIEIAVARDKLAKIKTRLGKPMAPATVVNYMAILSHVFSTAAQEWGWMTSNPIALTKKPVVKNERVRFLSVDEMARLKPVVDTSPCAFLPTIVDFSLLTGARRSEIANLTWDDVDWVNKRAYLRETKNGTTRAVILLPSLVMDLSALKKNAPAGAKYIFARVDGLKPFIFEKHWQAALDEAKIENFRFHDLRHTFASHLAMHGATLREIADALGHKTLQMVMRYSHLCEQHQHKRVHAMGLQLLAAVEEKMKEAMHGTS